VKVTVKFTVEIDADAWAAEYGLMRSDVRADVLDLVENATLDHLAGLGLLMPRKYG
jgi:hypothetical protein